MIRFSSPMTTSRLRRPISVSTMATFLPSRARAVPRLADVVVLPTPPLPDVMTIASPMPLHPFEQHRLLAHPRELVHLVDLHPPVLQVGILHGGVSRHPFLGRTADDIRNAQLRRPQQRRGDNGFFTALAARMGHSAKSAEHIYIPGAADRAAGVHVAEQQQASIMLHCLSGTDHSRHKLERLHSGLIAFFGGSFGFNRLDKQVPLLADQGTDSLLVFLLQAARAQPHMHMHQRPGKQLLVGFFQLELELFHQFRKLALIVKEEDETVLDSLNRNTLFVGHIRPSLTYSIRLAEGGFLLPSCMASFRLFLAVPVHGQVLEPSPQRDIHRQCECQLKEQAGKNMVDQRPGQGLLRELEHLVDKIKGKFI
ncbi:hypothetical protein BN871_AN_00040 [Paenibacillus sp. P22]|nr:hypothetical protein BN871_AN_00040 [Paenibacillus sp. P22]